MGASPEIRRLVRARNRELAVEALVELVLGLLFTALTFGVVFWLAWLAGFFVGRSIGLTALQLALAVTGIYALVAVVSAWRRVDPFAGLDPLTQQQMFLTMVSLQSAHMLYFSPRHASAGLAAVLIGGPANVFAAIGTWRHRLRADQDLIAEAASILADAREGAAVESIASPAAALLLRRLDLVKVVPRSSSAAILATEQGRGLLDAREAFA